VERATCPAGPCGVGWGLWWSFGALLGPEKTAAFLLWGVGGVLWFAAPVDRLTHRVPLGGCRVWWWSVVRGVWLCVECCIVDASILL
jgi:hypothetical protein